MEAPAMGFPQGSMEGQETTENAERTNGEFSLDALSLPVPDDGKDEFGRDREVVEWRRVDIGAFDPDKLSKAHELLRAGRIGWFLHPEQRRLAQWLDETDSSLLVACISRQFGKSFVTLAFCIAYCI